MKAIAITFLAIPIILFTEAKSMAQIQLFDGHSLDGWYTFLQDRGPDK